MTTSTAHGLEHSILDPKSACSLGSHLKQNHSRRSGPAHAVQSGHCCDLQPRFRRHNVPVEQRHAVHRNGGEFVVIAGRDTEHLATGIPDPDLDQRCPHQDLRRNDHDDDFAGDRAFSDHPVGLAPTRPNGNDRQQRMNHDTPRAGVESPCRQFCGPVLALGNDIVPLRTGTAVIGREHASQLCLEHSGRLYSGGGLRKWKTPPDHEDGSEAKTRFARSRPAPPPPVGNGLRKLWPSPNEFMGKAKRENRGQGHPAIRNSISKQGSQYLLIAASILAPKPAMSAAPTIAMFGSFFPSWLICLFSGVVATVILRTVFIIVGLDDILRWRVPTYMSMALGLTFLFSFFFFGR